MEHSLWYNRESSDLRSRSCNRKSEISCILVYVCNMVGSKEEALFLLLYSAQMGPCHIRSSWQRCLSTESNWLGLVQSNLTTISNCLGASSWDINYNWKTLLNNIYIIRSNLRNIYVLTHLLLTITQEERHYFNQLLWRKVSTCTVLCCPFFPNNPKM